MPTSSLSKYVLSIFIMKSLVFVFVFCRLVAKGGFLGIKGIAWGYGNEMIPCKLEVIQSNCDHRCLRGVYTCVVPRDCLKQNRVYVGLCEPCRFCSSLHAKCLMPNVCIRFHLLLEKKHVEAHCFIL